MLLRVCTLHSTNEQDERKERSDRPVNLQVSTYTGSAIVCECVSLTALIETLIFLSTHNIFDDETYFDCE